MVTKEELLKAGFTIIETKEIERPYHYYKKKVGSFHFMTNQLFTKDEEITIELFEDFDEVYYPLSTVLQVEKLINKKKRINLQILKLLKENGSKGD